MRLRSKPELALLVALSYIPFVASSPGQVSADSKQDLYLSPGRFLSRAIELWDPHVGAGTVPHQNLGYLFPTGPWFWVFDRLGAPDWIAQRLWLGTISLAAAAGARWLFLQLGTGQAGALAGALVYLLSPYQLAFTARMSVLLLPWAVLPWLVGLTMRATRERGWRPAAAVALCLVVAGGINASALLFIGIGPVLWIMLDVGNRRLRPREALAVLGKIGLLAGGVSLWWLVGVRVQGSHGLPVLQMTENLRTVAEFSTPSDVLRGLGNWFFYGRDRVGYSLDQAADYAGASRLVVVLSYAVPALAIGGAFLFRWAHRSYFMALVVVGTVVAVGSWPYAAPSPYGSAWQAFVDNTSFGLALRNSPRVVPVVVLGLAGLLAGAIGAVPAARWRDAAAGLTGALAVAALLPVWQHGFLTDGMLRPEQLPGYWMEAASAMDAGDQHTRVLEVPGSSFAAYRWGTTIDPITPGLIRRPYLAREVLPSGTPGTVNVLDALDRRMQLGILEPASVAPIARLLGVGTVALRADLQRSGRFDAPDPGRIWHSLLEAPGLVEPRAFGPPGGDGTDARVPAVALFDVARARAVIRSAPVEEPIVIAGDGDGLVDGAAAGLLDGSALVLQSSALSTAALEDALSEGASLILTDSNRRRAQTWFYALRDTRGETEQSGASVPDPTGYDYRLDPFPGTSDAHRTVVEQIGGSVTATAAGGPERPESRAAAAVDGNDRTAWRIRGEDPIGASISIVPDEPVPATEIRLLQPAGGTASITRVRVAVANAPPIEVDLGPASFRPPGQAVPVPSGLVSAVTITVLGTSALAPGSGESDGPGLAEVRFGDLHLREVVRLPTDLLTRVGDRLTGHSLDVVLTRLRVGLPDSARRDEETHLDRVLELPQQRTFSLTGTAQVADSPASKRAPDACRDDLLVIDDAALPIRLTVDGDAASFIACAAVTLDRGRHRLTTSPSAVSGIDIDRVVLSSGAGDAPAAIGPRGAPAHRAGAAVESTIAEQTRVRVALSTDGRPFWLVLAQSSSAGWRPHVAGAQVGPREMVDGFANGWRITPRGAGDLAVDLRWEPQRIVWAGLVAGAVSVAVCLLILARTTARRHPAPTDLGSDPRLFVGAPRAERRVANRAVAPLVVFVGGMIVAPPEMAAAAAILVLAADLVPRGGLLLAVCAPAALLASRATLRPSLAWVSVLLLASVAARDVWARGDAPSARADLDA